MSPAAHELSRARLYDCMHARKDYEAEARLLLELVGRSPVRCLDIGCGTGRHAAALAGAGAASVIGVDLDGEFIEAAADRAVASGLSATATFHVGDVTTTDPGPCDLVTLLFNVVNYVPSAEALGDLFRQVAALGPSLVAFDAWAPRAAGQPDVTRASRQFACDGERYVVDTTLRFDEAGRGSCGMRRTVRLLDEEAGRVVEDALLSMWSPEELVRTVSDAGLAATVTTWSAQLGTAPAPAGPEPFLFLCRPVNPGTSPLPIGGTA
jgi:SAM-dependent methyltransferase